MGGKRGMTRLLRGGGKRGYVGCRRGGGRRRGVSRV